ncbi:FecR domain-containing protein [Sphingomonas sp. 1185]|uniref:FecR family protein n=1 Tax=Sphingomonas sp. 1185 TaxID=3156411 RepID=UPI00339844E2
MSQPPQSPPDATIDTVAIDWALRMADPASADWDAFTDWLEADPDHAGRYDRAAAMLRDAADALAAHPDVMAAPVVVDDEPVMPARRRRPLGWIGGAVAAALVGMVGVPLWLDRPQPYAVETAAGEMRHIALPDGSRIMLAGGSRVTLDRADRRRAVVDRGEALFEVRHDAAHPFAVEARGIGLTDLGTVFDVRLGARAMRVAVAEGAVMVDPKGAALRLIPGQAVVAEGDRLIRQPVAIEQVGGWRQGRLAYDGVPLAEVAEDLSRFLRQPVAVMPAIADRGFRGTIELEAVREQPDLLGRLLDVRVRRQAAGWMLEPRG